MSLGFSQSFVGVRTPVANPTRAIASNRGKAEEGLAVGIGGSCQDAAGVDTVRFDGSSRNRLRTRRWTVARLAPALFSRACIGPCFDAEKTVSKSPQGSRIGMPLPCQSHHDRHGLRCRTPERTAQAHLLTPCHNGPHRSCHRSIVCSWPCSCPMDPLCLFGNPVAAFMNLPRMAQGDSVDGVLGFCNAVPTELAPSTHSMTLPSWNRRTPTG